MMKRVFIIAEAGVNHNGSLAKAKALIDVAARSGADAVKFQTFKAEHLVVPAAPRVEYQKKSGGKDNQFQMLKKLELSYNDFRILAEHCRRKKIMFLSTPFDVESLHLLVGLGMPIVKIPSGEITNAPLLKAVAKLKKKIILSTGMSYLAEVQSALKVIVAAGAPKSNITVLHCHSEYPTQFKDVNLKAMLTMKEKLGVPIGYSDHTPGIEVAVAAVAMGASIIEKHFTLDKTLPGPDHKASLDPLEFKRMVEAIRNTEAALGDGIKRPTSVELKNKKLIRRSIVANCNIAKGEKFSDQNLAVKRPAWGLSPMLWDELIGQKARRDFRQDEVIVL